MFGCLSRFVFFSIHTSSFWLLAFYSAALKFSAGIVFEFQSCHFVPLSLPGFSHLLSSLLCGSVFLLFWVHYNLYRSLASLHSYVLGRSSPTSLVLQSYIAGMSLSFLILYTLGISILCLLQVSSFHLLISSFLHHLFPCFSAVPSVWHFTFLYYHSCLYLCLCSCSCSYLVANSLKWVLSEFVSVRDRYLFEYFWSILILIWFFHPNQFWSLTQYVFSALDLCFRALGSFFLLGSYLCCFLLIFVCHCCLLWCPHHLSHCLSHIPILCLLIGFVPSFAKFHSFSSQSILPVRSSLYPCNNFGLKTIFQLVSLFPIAF